MIFLSPSAFFYIILFLPVLYLCLFFYRHKTKVLYKLYNKQYITKMKLKTLLWYKIISSFLLIAGISFALSSPKITYNTNEEIQQSSEKGKNIYILLDVSRSMYVKEKNRNTRMYNAIQFLKRILVTEKNNKIALILFTNKPALVVPLTSDTAYLNKVFDSLLSNPKINGPSDFTSFINTLYSNKNIFFPNVTNLNNNSFLQKKSIVQTNTQILLISDGEFHTFTNPTSLSQFSQMGLTINTVSVGTREGGVVPNTTNTISKANISLMKNLAHFSGGNYIRVEDFLQNKQNIVLNKNISQKKDISFIGYIIGFIALLIYSGTIVL